MTMRLITESDFKVAGGTIGLGFDTMRWPMPVRPGDELHIESEILELRPSQSRPDRGLMKVRTRTLNQNGDIVQELTANVMVPRRPETINLSRRRTRSPARGRRARPRLQ